MEGLHITPEKSPSNIERQFQEPHYLELENGEKLKYTIVKPDQETEKTEWVVVVGGFSSTKEMWEEEIKDLAKSGKRVVFATPDKGIQPDKEQVAYFQTEGKTIPPTIQNKAATIKKLLDHLGISRTNIVGQSQGGVIATSLAGLYPELVTKLLLDSSAGIVDQSLPSFMSRAVVDAGLMQAKSTLAQIKEKISKKRLDPELAAKDFAQWEEYRKKFRKDLKWRLTTEVPEIGKSNILPILESIQKRKRVGGSEYPKIILLNANDDIVFPSRGVEKSMGIGSKDEVTENEANSFLKYVDSWVMYIDKKMGHGKYERPAPGMIPTVFNGERQQKSGAIVDILE